VIAALSNNKRKEPWPDQTWPENPVRLPDPFPGVRLPEPDFTPLEEILGERRAPGFAQAFAKPEPQRTLPRIDGASRAVDSSSMAGSREPQITPLEEILGERRAAVSPPASAKAEPQLNLPTIGDVWQRMQAEKQDAAAYNAARQGLSPAQTGVRSQPRGHPAGVAISRRPARSSPPAAAANAAPAPYSWLRPDGPLVKNYSDGKQNFTHPVGPQLIAGSGYSMSAGDRFNAFMAPKTGALLTAMADARNPGGDHTLARQADDLFLALGGLAAARAGQSSSMLGAQGRAWDAGPGRSATTWRWTTPGETLYHYGQIGDAPKFRGGLRTNAFATGTGLLTGAEAKRYLALREQPNAAYTVSPDAGTLIGVNPVVERKYGEPGAGHEYLLPTGTGHGTVSWPRRIP
jgi:hypothetical protein